MTITLSNMRSNIRKSTGVEDEADLATTDIDLALNKAYWHLQSKFEFREKQITTTFLTVAGTSVYILEVPLEAVKSLAIQDLDTDEHEPLDPMTADVYEQSLIANDDEYGMPKGYLLEENYVRLWPTPDDVYTVTLRRLKTLADLVGVNDVPDLPKEWHEIIEIGGKWRIFADHIGNLVKSNYWSAKEAELINVLTTQEVKEKDDYHRAGLQYIGRTY